MASYRHVGFARFPVDGKAVSRDLARYAAASMLPMARMGLGPPAALNQKMKPSDYLGFALTLGFGLWWA
jgi:hypothetical protein